MFAANNITVSFSGSFLFEDISFNVNPRDRIGLVGRNGAGKTTLLRIIAGIHAPDSGSIIKPSDATIGYLPQEMRITSKQSVYAEALTAFKEAIDLETEISFITNQLAERTDYESRTYTNLIARLNEANDRFHLIGGHKREEDVARVLIGLGFSGDDFERPLTEFSVGWQMRVELAKILLKMPSILLLDEPTNHLDIESIQWLEDFLTDYPGSVMLVSHDRALLDNVTNRTIEISLGRAYDFKYSYTDYVEKREEDRVTQMAAFNNQQIQIAQITKFVERFRYKNTKAKQVQSKLKQLDKMDKIEVEDMDSSAIRFQFPPAPHSGKVVVEASNLSKSYGNNLVLKPIEFSIIKNDFVAFVGKNGMGKTTLSRIIIGDLDYTGTMKLGHMVKIGYYAQNQAEMLDPEKTVFETIDDVAVGDIRPKIRNILGSFLFGGESIDKKVKVLSGGEKSRLALAKLLLTPVNLLVLDEPTNHLDMVSKDILKNALLQFDGTLILVSHDRDFLQGLTNKVIEFRNHTIRQHLGDVYDFLESRKLESLKELERNNIQS
jgi:ATP-binding cassette subfamily F protein 3